jgi:hypothetical protein
MKKLLIASVSDGLSTLQNFIKFNGIEFDEVDVWNKDLVDLSQIDDSAENLLILPTDIFIELISFEDSLNILLNHRHQILVWDDIDGMFKFYQNLDKLTKLDSMLSGQSRITAVVDGSIDFDFKNIQVKNIPYNHFMRVSRKSLNVPAETISKDFILTMNKNRPHRTFLWNKLNEKNLLNKGFCVYHGIDSKSEWIGETSRFDNCHELHTSMDLYNHSFFEIVPETCHDAGLFITEKTMKPISTRFPFLALSTPGFLKYLRSYGFKTFGELIDEKYDEETDLEKRTDLVVEQVEKIIATGSENFYLASRDICEHNYKKLCEITGDRDEKIDQFIFDLLVQN